VEKSSKHCIIHISDQTRIKPKFGIVHSGRNYTIECFTDGRLQWLHKSQRKLPDNVKKLHSALIFSHVGMKNDGDYECVGQYSNGSTFFARSTLRIDGKGTQ